MKSEIVLNITLDGTGTEIPVLNVTAGYTEYNIKGTATATGNYTINPTGTPKLGSTFIFNYQAVLDITTNGTTFSIFGESLNQVQLNSKLLIECKYNGTAWIVFITPSMDDTIIQTTNIVDLAVTTGKIANNAITAIKLATNAVETAKINALAVTTAKIDNLAVTDAKINDVDGSKIINASIDGDVKLIDNSVTKDKLELMTAASVRVSDASGDSIDLPLGANEIPIGDGAGGVTTIDETELKDGAGLYDTFIVPVSFETGEQGFNRIYTLFGGTIASAFYMTTKAFAATDDATLQLRINGVNVGGGSFTIPASTAINQVATITPTSAFTFPAGATIDAMGTKTTAGGRLLLSIVVQRT